MPLISSGLLLYRQRPGQPAEVFLLHPGGPFFAKKDKGWWSIPKGLPEEGESLEDAALREFKEETGYTFSAELLPLGSVKQKGGKTVHAFALKNDLPEDFEIKSNTFRLEWPPRSGKFRDYPEADKGRFFSLDEAKEYMNEAQGAFIDRLEQMLKEG